MSFLDELDAKVKAQGGLIVSCQPVPGSPLDKPDIIAAMALAAEQAGAGAGASIIAFDGTRRPRPVSVDALLARIQHHQLIAMADCASQEEGLYCHQQGTQLIGTTLSGYTTDETPTEPDLALVASLSQAGCRVVAEGRYNAPELAAQAIKHGAWTVTVGSAITRLEHICQWYRDAL